MFFKRPPDHDKYFELLLRKNRSRVAITILTIVLFIGIVGGVIYALLVQAEVSSSWKEILLLLMGAFIGAYGRVMDFWFNNSETDIELMRQSSGGQPFPPSTSNNLPEPPCSSTPNIINIHCNKQDLA